MLFRREKKNTLKHLDCGNKVSDDRGQQLHIGMAKVLPHVSCNSSFPPLHTSPEYCIARLFIRAFSKALYPGASRLMVNNSSNSKICSHEKSMLHSTPKTGNPLIFLFSHLRLVAQKSSCAISSCNSVFFSFSFNLFLSSAAHTVKWIY